MYICVNVEVNFFGKYQLNVNRLNI